MESTARHHLQRLLSLFHHSPIAMVEMDDHRTIRQANPKAIQLLMPLSSQLNLTPDNMLNILRSYLPAVCVAIIDFAPDSGFIIDQEPYPIQLMLGQSFIRRLFNLTVYKTAPTDFPVFFEDITNLLTKAEAIRQHL